MQIIKNFLDDDIYNTINKFIMSGHFQWFYSPNVAESTDTHGFYFFHAFYNIQDGINSEFHNDIAIPITYKLKFSKLLRARANLYTRQENAVKHNFHIDDTINKNHKVALYSINTNNGYTEFEDGKIVKSIGNQMCIFDGHIKHRSVTQTDENLRVNVNMNYLD